MSMERRRRLIGTVASDKMEKTVIVRVERSIRHPLYRKVLRRSKNYACHDANNEAKPGDMVQMVESRPLSRTKRWTLEQIIRKAE